MSKQLESEDWRDIANGRERATTPTSGNDAKIDSLAKKRDHAADVLGKPLLALSYQQEIDALLATSGNDEVEAMALRLEAWAINWRSNDDYDMFGKRADRLEEAATLLRKLSAPVGNDEVEATLAELAAVGKEMDALGYDRDIFAETAALIRKQADELAWRRQEMTKLIEIVASSATQIAELQREAKKVEYAAGSTIKAQQAQIAELQKATAQTSASPTPADSAARPETE